MASKKKSKPISWADLVSCNCGRDDLPENMGRCSCGQYYCEACASLLKACPHCGKKFKVE